MCLKVLLPSGCSGIGRRTRRCAGWVSLSDPCWLLAVDAVLTQASSASILTPYLLLLQGSTPGCQLFSGSIGLDVNQLQQLGLISWIDKLVAASGTGASAGTASYEQVAGVPGHCQQ